MLRYMAFVWCEADAGQARVVQRLASRIGLRSPSGCCVVDRPGLKVHVWTDGQALGEVQPLADDGVLLGRLFTRVSDEEGEVPIPAILNAGVCARIARSGGRELIEGGYWGNYVALWRNPEDRHAFVLRGPASSLPCLYTSYRGVSVVFSCPEDLVRLAICRVSVDWEYLLAQLIVLLPSRHTGLRQVTELRSGECMRFDGGRSYSVEIYWDPRRIAQAETHCDRDLAATLRWKVKACVQAWATGHGRILHNLSGGLDSSIVLAALKGAPASPELICVTDYSVGADSDERAYARLAAACGRPCLHVETRRDASVRLEGMLGASRWIAPQGYLRRVEVARSRAELAQEYEASAIFDGSGGDQVFFSTAGSVSASDFVCRHGFAWPLARIIYISAQLERLSIWQVIGRALLAGGLSGRRDLFAELTSARTLLAADVIAAWRSNELVDSVRTHLAGLSPGKTLQVFLLSTLNDYYDPLGQPEDPVCISPLLSQPLLETVLRIPSYATIVGGMDRGLARRAFAAELPRAILQRRSKGGISEHIMAVLRANLPFLRELLLDGVLAQRRFLDRTKVAELLADRPTAATQGMAEIMRLICVEVWLRLWLQHAEATLPPGDRDISH